MRRGQFTRYQRRHRVYQRYIKNLLISTREDIDELNESEEIARSYYCKYEIMSMLQKSREKINYRALIMV